MRRLRILAVAMLLAGPALASAQPAVPDLAKVIAPLTDGQTAVVFHMRLDTLKAAGVVKSVTPLFGLKQAEAQQMEIGLNMALGVLKQAGVQEVYAVAGLGGFPWNAACLAVPVVKEDDGKNMIAALQNTPGVGNEFKGKLHVIPGFVIFGSEEVAQRLAKVKSDPPAQLAKALGLFDKADAQLAVVLPDALRRSLGELAPTLPKELGGGKMAPLLEGFQYFAAGLTLTPKISAEATLQANDAKSATAIRKLLLSAMTALKDHAVKESGNPELGAGLDKALALLAPKLDKDRLTWKLTEDELVPIAQPIVLQLRAAAQEATSANNLKQIALAMHVYYDTYKHFPTNITDKNGKALLSWRVQILPYLEQNQLYQQFKLDEPWDSKHNKELIAKIPAVFRHPKSKAAPEKTTYLMPAGPGLFQCGKLLSFKDITDGSSNTIMVLEVDDEHAASWTKPDDLTVDPKQPVKGLPAKFHAAFADGSVQLLQNNINPKAFYGLLTIAGGEIRPEDLYKKD